MRLDPDDELTKLLTLGPTLFKTGAPPVCDQSFHWSTVKDRERKLWITPQIPQYACGRVPVAGRGCGAVPVLGTEWSTGAAPGPPRYDSPPAADNRPEHCRGGGRYPAPCLRRATGARR
jgi:hypothetical protein